MIRLYKSSKEKTQTKLKINGGSLTVTHTIFAAGDASDGSLSVNVKTAVEYKKKSTQCLKM